MIEPLDRLRRDSTLFQFTSKQLRDFIVPNHLLIRIDKHLDFAKLVEPLEEYYCPDFGRPAIHPEVMIRALLICSLYNIASLRRLCSAISENLAYRWFCFLTIDDPVFDHSSISHFIDRIGQDGFAAVFEGLNDELLRMGLLSLEMYADGSLVKANVSSHDLSRSGLTVEEFKEQAIEVNGLFLLPQSTVDEDGVEHEEVRYFQDPNGKLPLSAVDTDARWRNSRPGPAFLSYEENIVVDRGGFILARGATHSSQAEWKVMPELLERMPIQPVSLAADTAYSAGQFRQILEARGITAYIPIHPVRENALVSKGDFTYHGDHLVCRQGKVLYRSGWMKRDRAYQYVAHQRDCQRCPVKEQCLPAKQKRRYVALSMYHPWMLLAQQRNSTAAYRREKTHRRTIAEGTFASLDRLGWAASRLRGLWKVDCEGYMAALAHNVLKMARRLGRGLGLPGPVAPADAGAANGDHNTNDPVVDFVLQSWRVPWVTWWTIHLRPAPRWNCRRFGDLLNGPFSPPFTPDPDATGYRVDSGEGTASQIVSGEEHVVDGLTNGTSYTFRVQALNPGGDSDWRSASVRPQASRSRPPKPTNLRVEHNNSRRFPGVALEWDAPFGSYLYEVRISGGGATPWKRLTFKPGGEASSHSPYSARYFGSYGRAGDETDRVINVGEAIVAGLLPGTEYHFAVRTARQRNSSENLDYSPWSKLVTLTTPGIRPADAPGSQAAPALKAPPEDLMAEVSGTTVNLTWTATTNPNYTSQRLLRRVAGVSPIEWTEIPLADVNVTTYTDTGLTSGTTYRYRVRAYKDSGNYGEEKGGFADAVIP